MSNKIPCDYCLSEETCTIRSENCKYIQKYYDDPSDFEEYVKNQEKEEMK